MVAQHRGGIDVNLAADMNEGHLIANVAGDREIHVVLLILGAAVGPSKVTLTGTGADGIRFGNVQRACPKGLRPRGGARPSFQREAQGTARARPRGASPP